MSAAFLNWPKLHILLVGASNDLVGNWNHLAGYPMMT
jgi:hypothetical protein